mmetsp:Transcript_39520/g.92358  ORF Transcript_39520/g.92358 Transcript_39520/m.92358 type:complete len:86 (-) Transcript_39520:2248-2505(-)
MSSRAWSSVLSMMGGVSTLYQNMSMGGPNYGPYVDINICGSRHSFHFLSFEENFSLPLDMLISSKFCSDEETDWLSVKLMLRSIP